MPSGPFWIAVVLGVLLFVVLMMSASALFIFGVGAALSYFLVPVVDRLEVRGWNRGLAAILVVVITMVTILMILGAVVLIVIDQGVRFLDDLPAILQQLGERYESLDLPVWLRAGLDALIASIQDNLGSIDQSSMITGVIGSLAGMVGGLFVWLLLPFFLFYLLKDQPRMAANFYERVPAPWKADVGRMLTITLGNFAQYCRAELIVGSMMFATVTVGMFLIGFITESTLLIQFALLLGLIAFVMELIPQIGPILSYVPALILATPSGADAIVLVSVFYFVIFNIEGSVLVPTFEGRIISFSGATVLVLITIGFALAGIVGAILALPMASIIRDLFRLFFDKAVEQDLVPEPTLESRPDVPGQPATTPDRDSGPERVSDRGGRGLPAGQSAD